MKKKKFFSNSQTKHLPHAMNAERVRDIEQTMLMMADKERRRVLMRFFKTGKGQYGEGDSFLGVRNPQVRQVVKLAWKTTSASEAATLARNPWHEIRLCGLLILVEHFQHALKRKDDAAMTDVFNTYVALHPWVNNWDLVDLSVYKIVGEYEMRHPEVTLMDEWIQPDHTLWQQRMAMVATWKHIRLGRYDKVLERAAVLLSSRHDLLHKAAGWMLRELYKHSAEGRLLLDAFLDAHVERMPAVMLSYATERMPASAKTAWRLRRHPQKLQKL